MREDLDSWVRSKCTWYCHFKSVPDKALSCALQLCVQCCREDREPQSCTKSSKQFLIRTNPPAIVQLGVPPVRVLVLRVLNKTAWKNLPDSYLYSRLRLEVEVLGARKALQFDNVLKTTLKASGQSQQVSVLPPHLLDRKSWHSWASGWRVGRLGFSEEFTITLVWWRV